MKTRFSKLAALFHSAALFLLLTSCSQKGFYGLLGDEIDIAQLTLSPAASTIPVNGSITFTANGGVPPYLFSLASGGGSVSSSTGKYTAAASAGSAVIKVTDARKNESSAAVEITSPSGPLTIIPSDVTMNVGGTLTFLATGGTPPYAFSITAAGSSPPAPTIDCALGAYAAGSALGTDTITVTDAEGALSSTTVTVTAAQTGVDYGISSESLPSSGVGETPLAAGSSFTITNTGASTGTAQVSYWVFLSPTAAPSSGTVLLQSGSIAPLGPSASAPVGLSWTWPPVAPVLPGVTRHIYLLISAADDLETANNAYAGPAITIAPPEVDYAVSGVSSTGSLVAGSPLSGSFTITNTGSDNGGEAIGWTAYISPDASDVIDADASPIDTGSLAALSAGTVQTVPISGSWPWTVGTLYLKVAVSAGDDVESANNIQTSPPYLTTYADYAVSGVTSTGQTFAGGALTGTFTLQNVGTTAGAQTVSWVVYASTNPSLDAGDNIAASGSVAPLGSGASTSVPFSGVWPASTGAWYLIATISAEDDSTASNNTAASAAATVNPVNLDYAVVAVNVTGGSITPAGTFTGSFQFKNNGINNGIQYPIWTVYASTSSVFGGSAVQVGSGTVPPLAAGTTSGVIPVSGRWPLIYGVYYVFVTVSTTVDVETNPADNTRGTAAATSVGIYTEYELNGDIYLTNYNDFGITLQPGMSVMVTGAMSPTDGYDIFSFTTGTASGVTFSWSWTATGSSRMYVMNAPGFYIYTVSDFGVKSLSMYWTPVDAPSTERWISLENTSGGPLGNYTLILSAN